MLQIPRQNYLAWKVCITALHVVAIGMTLLRVRIRWRDAKLWWDDHVAAAVTLLDMAFAITFWLMFGTQAEDPAQPMDVTKFGGVSVMISFLVIAVSRVTVALSIARVFPVATRERTSLIAMAAFFFWTGCSLCILNGVLCRWTPPPEDRMFPEYGRCQPGTWGYWLVGYLSTAADFLSDIIVLLVPLVFLWRISLPPNERRLVHGAISATGLITLSAVVASVFWLAPIDLGVDVRIIVAGVLHIQSAISVTICNLLVVATYWWRKAYRRGQPIPHRYRHNDPNIPTSKPSTDLPPIGSGPRSDNPHTEVDTSIERRTSHGNEYSSQLPDNLSFTPISGLSAASASGNIWRDVSESGGTRKSDQLEGSTSDCRPPLPQYAGDSGLTSSPEDSGNERRQ